MYDCIIIGSGPIGLYVAYRLLSQTTNILVLEKEESIGGRVGNITFHNTTVVTGAGIGRLKKDGLLINLLNQPPHLLKV